MAVTVYVTNCNIYNIIVMTWTQRIRVKVYLCIKEHKRTQ